MVQRILQVAKSLFLHVANHPMPVGASVLSTGDVNPIVLVNASQESASLELRKYESTDLRIAAA